MDMMYRFMRRTHQGESKNRPHPTFIEVTNDSISKCSQFLSDAQKGMKGMDRIRFERVLRVINTRLQLLDDGIYHIVYKKRRVYSGKSAMAGHNTRMVFFLYDSRNQRLFFCGFLRTFLRESWENTSGDVQTGITIFQSTEDISQQPTVVLPQD